MEQAIRSDGMRACHFSRRAIGLLAAYVVALQALILPASMPPSAVFADTLCTAEGAAGPAPPADHDHSCPCCAGCGMQCAAPALADAPPAVPVPPQAAVVAAAVPIVFAPSPRPDRRAPQMPRGPPTA